MSSIATTGSPVANYGYDATGNTTARPGPAGDQTLSWDAEGKLRRLTQQSGTTDYIYDADGNLLLRKSPGKTTLFVGPLEVTLDTETRRVTSKRTYSIGGKEIAVRSSLTNRSWLVNDHHGTSHVAINSSTLEATYRYSTPFGTPRGAEPAAWPDEHGFLGKPEDKSTGLTHIGAREYDPRIGRFISVDPVMDTADPQQMLGYTYANCNPTSMSDPTGLINDHDDGGGGGGSTGGGDTGGGEEDDNGGNNGGTDGGTNGGGDDDDDDDDGGGNIFSRAIRKGKSAGKSFLNYHGGQANQAIDTVIGIGNLGFENTKCRFTFECDFQINLVRSVVEDPKVLWTATVDPIRADWNSGNKAGAAGRVGFMFAEALLGTKGAGAAASTTARAGGAAARAGGAAGRGTGGLADSAPIPPRIFREGRPNPANLRVREGEKAVSFRGTLSNPWVPPAQRPTNWRPVFRPGENYFSIDTEKLPAGSVVPDDVPPGHVSVYDVDVNTFKEAVIETPPWPRFPR